MLVAGSSVPLKAEERPRMKSSESPVGVRTVLDRRNVKSSLLGIAQDKLKFLIVGIAPSNRCPRKQSFFNICFSKARHPVHHSELYC